MGVHLSLYRLAPDDHFEVTGRACETNRRLPHLSFEAPDPEELPAHSTDVVNALQDYWRREWAAQHVGAVLAPWDRAINKVAYESLYLGKTWDALLILFGAEQWGGERGPSPASAGPLARAVFGTHCLPPALDQLLDFPIRYNLPDEIGAMKDGLQEVDLSALADAVPGVPLPSSERRVFEDLHVDHDVLDGLQRFYERACEAGQVVLCVLS